MGGAGVYKPRCCARGRRPELLYPGRPLEPLDKLRELDFGAFENRTITDLEQDPAFRAWIAAPAGAAPPQGESAAALLGRAVEAVAYIFARMMEERVTSVAVVTHGALIMNLLAAMGLPEPGGGALERGPGEGYTLLLSAQMWMRDPEVRGLRADPLSVRTGGQFRRISRPFFGGLFTFSC